MKKTREIVRILLCIFMAFFMEASLAACNATPAASDAENNAPMAGEQMQGDAGQADGGNEQTEGIDAYATSDTPSAQQETKLQRYADAVPVVYMANEITEQSMLALYQSLCREIKGDNTAVYVSAGEPMGSDDLDSALLGGIVQYVDGTIAVCATADDGSASGTDRYSQAQEHGFTKIADVVVLDEDGSVSILAEEGIHLQEYQVGAHFPEYDGYLIVSHFTEHPLTGFRGAVHSISLGVGSAEGKRQILEMEQTVLLESMAEAGKAVFDALDGNLLYVNVLKRMQTDNAAMQDIGILACTDPVALDQACVDLIYMAQGSEPFVEVIEAQNGEYVLEHAEEVGLGNSAYTLVTLDE
ncbi:MAG: DUF362 domain-containing protein [Eubacterium sp.]|nr:DUF362 domain-containing protein [Eubacterium sp.]